ncbi:arpin isoform X3 [Rhincodon typus]|uniref:arpin isoform X3 n=1 Tax=Rhincodon typus TaxID=259920 RepID=UPI00203093B9|nr:arpin isoform X3 [Rhincodon typus]
MAFISRGLEYKDAEVLLHLYKSTVLSVFFSSLQSLAETEYSVFARRSFATTGNYIEFIGLLGLMNRNVLIFKKRTLYAFQHRYFILYIQPTRIHKRKFDSAGVEIEPNFSETKKVNTGYLMSSFKVEAAGQTDKISVEDLKRLINKPELIKISEKHTPKQSLAFWISEGEMEDIELEVEDGLRLKTLGDSPFIFSLAKMDAGTVTKCNFAGGEQVGASWTDNVFAAKHKTEQEAKVSTQGEGADEDEWDD